MRYFLHTLLTVLLTFVFAVTAGAQEIYYQQITEDDNLPSNTIYDILQDEEDYIWFSTDFGVARYNGLTMEIIPMPEELKDISIIRMYLDCFGRIWFLNYSGVLSYYENGKVIVPGWLNRLTDPYVKHYIDHIFIDTTGMIWLTPLTGGIFVADTLEGIREVYPGVKGSENWYCEYRTDRKDSWLAVVGDTAVSGENVPADWIEGNSFIRCMHRDFGSYRHIAIEGDDIYLAIGKVVYHLREGNLIDSVRFENNIASIYTAKGEGLWVSEFFNGVHHFPGRRIDSVSQRFFSDMTVSRIFKDNQHNYWFTTTQDGCYLVHDFDLKVYPVDQSIRYHVLAVTGGGGKIFFSTYDERVFSVEPLNGSIRRLDPGDMNDHAFDIMADSRNNLWIASSEHQCYDLDGTPRPPDTISSAYVFYEMEEGSVILASTHLATYRDRKRVSSTLPEPGLRIQAVAEKGDGTLYIGTRKGLYEYREGIFDLVEGPSELENLRILSLQQLNGKLLIGTAADGLLWMDNATGEVRKSEIRSLVSTAVRAICTINDSLVFLGTNNGLYKVSGAVADTVCTLEYHYHAGNGLSTNDVNDLYFDGERLWAGTDRGLCSLDPYRAPSGSVLPSFRIERLIANGTDMGNRDSLVLDNKQRNIRIEFSGVTFDGPSSLNFRYRLVGHDPEIMYTDNDFVTYSSLSSGDYTFHVNAGDMNGNFHRRPLVFHFSISKNFTETIWFIILVSLGGFLVVGGMGYLAFSFFHYRSMARHNLLVTRHQLLRSQMNPHFLFNALLAVQSYIYKNQPAEAARYLSSFSKLMRLTLNSSRKEIVTLDKEIDYLKNYLDLQQVRFGGKFTYHIHLQNEIDPERIAIPPLLAQPFIENAVEHGIRNIDYEGVIIIRYSIHNGEILYEIEDNGVGLFAGQGGMEDGSIREEPLGIRITRERIRLLRKISGKKFIFKIENMEGGKEGGRGTKVSFLIQYTIV